VFINDEALVKSIKEKLKNDPTFKLAIIVGENVYDETAVPEDSKLGELLKSLKEDPEFDYKNRVLTRGFYNAQGIEVTYALVNAPAGHLLVSQEDVESDNVANEEMYANRVQILSMAIGRASRFSDIVINDDFPAIVSMNAVTTEKPPRESSSFKKVWGSILMNSVLPNYDSNIESFLALGENVNNVNSKEATPVVPTTTVTPTVTPTPTKVTPTVKPPKPVPPKVQFTNPKVSVGNYVVINTYDKNGKLKKTIEGVVGRISSDAKVARINIYSPVTGELEGYVTNGQVKDGKVEVVKAASKYEPKEIAIKGGKMLITTTDNELVGLTGSLKTFINDLNLEGLDGVDMNNLNDVKDKAKLKVQQLKKAGKLVEADELEAVIKGLDSILHDEQRGEDFIAEELPEELNGMSDKDIMKEIERETGEVPFFGTISSKSNEASFVTSYFNLSDVLGNNFVYDAKDMPLEADKALGLQDAGGDTYSYHVISYEFIPRKGKLGYQHAIIAKNKTTGKVVMLGLLGEKSNYDADSTLAKFMDARERSLAAVNKKLQGKTLDTKLVENDLDMTKERLVGKRVPYVNNLPAGRVQNSFKYALVSDIQDFNNEFMQGVSVGVPVTTRANIVTDLINLGALPEENNFYKESEYKAGLVTETTTLAGLEALSEEAINSKARLVVDRNTKGGVLFETDGIKYITVGTQVGSIPFAYIDVKQKYGNKVKTVKRWVPVIGITADGKMIYAPELVMGKGKNSDLEAISKALTKHEWLHDMDAEATESSILPDILGYTSLADYYGMTLDKASLLELFKEVHQSYVGNVRAPLSDARGLWKQTGGPSHISSPYVFLRGKHAGKTVIFYSYDAAHPVDTLSEAEMQELFDDVMRETSKNSDVKLATNRLGIGYIIVDPKSMGFKEIYHKRIIANGSKFMRTLNRVVIQGKAEERLLSLLASLHLLLNPTSHTERAEAIVAQFGKQQFKIKNKAKYKKLALILDQIFAPENMGKLSLSGLSEEERIAIEAAIGNAEAAIANNTDANGIVDREAAETDYKASLNIFTPDFKAIIEQYNGNSLEGVLQYTVHEGADAVGKVKINPGTNKASIESTYKSALTFITKEDLKKLGADSVDATAQVDIIKLMNILTNATDDTAEADEVLEQLDEFLEGTTGMSKKFLVSPVCNDTKHTIAKALPSGEEELEKTLTTNVKQIFRPNIIINANQKQSLYDFFRPLQKKTPEQHGNVQAVADSISKLNSATSLKDLNKIYSKLKNKKNAKVIAAYNEKARSFKVPTVKADLSQNSVVDIFTDAVSTKAKVAAKAFDELYKLTATKADALALVQRLRNVVADDEIALSKVDAIAQWLETQPDTIITEGELRANIKKTVAEAEAGALNIPFEMLNTADFDIMTDSKLIQRAEMHLGTIEDTATLVKDYVQLLTIQKFNYAEDSDSAKFVDDAIVRLRKLLKTMPSEAQRVEARAQVDAIAFTPNAINNVEPITDASTVQSLDALQAKVLAGITLTGEEARLAAANGITTKYTENDPLVHRFAFSTLLSQALYANNMEDFAKLINSYIADVNKFYYNDSRNNFGSILQKFSEHPDVMANPAAAKIVTGALATLGLTTTTNTAPWVDGMKTIIAREINADDIPEDTKKAEIKAVNAVIDAAADEDINDVKTVARLTADAFKAVTATYKGNMQEAIKRIPRIKEILRKAKSDWNNECM